MAQTRSINSSFLSLQPYPNKQLLSRSKITKFSSNSQLFQQRCALLAEVCYLLLKLQVQERSVYLSKTMYLSPQGLLFMLFSFEEQFKDRLKLVQFSSVNKNMVNAYDTIFNSKEQESAGFDDCQLEHIYVCTRQLFQDFRQTSPKSKDFKSQERMQVECPCDGSHSTKAKLQNSLLFQQYCFPLKISKAIMIRPIAMAGNLKGSQIMDAYIELLGTQEGIFRAMKYENGDFDAQGIFSVYGDKMVHFFRLMQADNYLKITNIEEGNKYMKKNTHQVFQMAFSSNLRKMGHYNTTALENSSESSGNNVSEEEKQKNTRKIEYLQTLAHLKNEIHFQIDIFYDNQRKEFKIEIQGQSQWVIEEYYYNFFCNLWAEFNNKWLSSTFGVGERGEQGRTHKWKMIQRQKNPTIYERFYLTDRNLLKEIIVVIDKIVIMLLLFENILKNLHKTGLSLKEYEKLALGNLENTINLDGLVSLYGQTIKEYLTFEDILQQIDFNYLRR